MSFKILDNCKEENIKIYDNLFKKDALSNFYNNKYANAIFINEIESNEYTSVNECENIYIEDREIKLIDTSKEGVYVSTSICTDEKFGLALNNFFLIVENNICIGETIDYYIIFNDNRMFQLRPNYNMPLKIEGGHIDNFKIKAILKTNTNNSPKIKALAVLYYDKMVEHQLGLINPNLRPNDFDKEEKIFLEFESIEDLL